MEEEDDDLYDPADALPVAEPPKDVDSGIDGEVKMDLEDGEEEEEEDEEEDDEDDFRIITEAAPEVSEPTTQASRHVTLRNEPTRPPVDIASTSKLPVQSSAPPKVEHQAASSSVGAKPATALKPGSSYPAHHTSTIDVNANPIHSATSKPLLSTDLDADFPGEDDKPWRRPGTDVTDYFNYGFDEFTWASYCLKQQELRKEVTDQKKQLEEMQAFLGMTAGALPGMPNAPTPPVPGMGTPATGVGPGGSTPGPQPGTAAQPSMPGMQGGMPEISQEMMQGMLGSMMAQGLDPTTMDPMTFMQHAQAMVGGAQPGPGGAPGGQPGFGGQQQMGYGGYDQRGGGFVGAGRGKIGRRW